jgi:hypothetical protein
MREIKFRAWDTDMGKMDYEVWISPGGQGYYFCDGEPEPLSNNIMQFTGLHDNNGKEIYEGDILERYSDMVPKGSNPFVRSVVEWEKYRWEGIWGFMSGVVIGNIYENPELLKEK